jgi:ABC-type bacteriocin/lantibiotic exporter with double-glycine peptidase domain
MSASFVTSELIAFAKAHPFLVAFNTLLSFTFPIDDVLVPFLLGIIVTRLEKGQNWMKPLTILVTVFISMQIIYTSTYWHDARLVPALQNFIKHRIIESLSAAYDGRPIDFNSGEMLSRIVKIPVYITDFYQQMKNWTLPYMISFLITATLLLRYDRKIGSIVIATGVAIFILIFASPRLCNSPTKVQEVAQSAVDEEADDVIQNLQNIYAANTLPKEFNRLSSYERTYEKTYLATMTCIAKYRFVATAILAAMVISIMFLAHKGIKNKTITTGVLITILTIIAQWFSTLGWLAGQMRDMVIDWGVISSFKLPTPTPTQTPKTSPTQAPPKIPDSAETAIITVKDVYFTMPPKSPILEAINLSIAPNSRTAIIGEIGSGKSTLLKLLINFYTPTQGTIYLNQTPIQSLSKESIRNMIAYVPQNPALFNRSIYENITYGAKHPLPDQQTINNLLISLGFKEDQVNRPAGKGGQLLSGGQRQIIATLRAIFQQPKILLLDEITSSIDEQTKQKFFVILDQLLQNKTAIFVTHDPSVLTLVTRTIYMEKGRIIKDSRV